MDYTKAFDGLYNELVPEYGPAETREGELVRAVARIGYRFYNDGDRIGVGYGNETCNPAARYILSEFPGEEFAKTINGLWGLDGKHYYERGLTMLIEQVVDFIAEHPGLKEEENDVDYDEDYYDSDDKNWEEVETVEEEPFAVYDPNDEGVL